jgi:hypothetical protein
MNLSQAPQTTTIVFLLEGKDCLPFKNNPLNDTGSVGLVLLVFFFLAISFRGGYKYITEISQHLFSVRKRQNAFEIHTMSETMLMIALIANTCIMSGILFNLGIDYLHPEMDLSQHVFKSVGSLTLLCSAFFTIQMLLFYVLGYVFAHDREDTRLWLDGFKSSQAILGLILSPLTFVSLIYPASTPIMLSIAVFAYFSARIVFICKGFRIFFNNFSSYVYFILYLCTIEIVPVFLMCAGAINLCEII